jgi:tetratricopeptide (TPR) repeat protein
VAVDRERILQTAQKYVSKKRYDRAIAEYQKIVQTDPNDARTLLKIGDLQARLELYAEAIGTYDKVGEFYSRQGFALKAIAVYKQIRELIKKHAPQLEERYGHITPKLAEIYTQLGLTSDALAAYDEVAARLQKAGRDRDAIDVFRKMVSLDTTNPLPHLRLAEACCRVQQVDPAIESFWAAAQLLIRLGRREDALKVVERILHFRMDLKFAKIAADLYLGRGTHADGMQALAKLQVCFQHDPKDLETLELLARAFSTIDQTPKAVEVKKEIARIAKEQQKAALFRETVTYLMEVAPRDEQVIALAQQLGTEEAVSVSEVESVRSVPSADLYSVPPAEVRSAPPGDMRNQLPTAPSLDVEEIDFDDAPMSRALMASVPDLDVEEVEDLEMQDVAEGLVIVEEELVAIDDVGDAIDVEVHVRKALSDAESFRGLRLYSKALETLTIALEVDPRSIALRERLRDVLAEAGDTDAVIGEMIALASIHLENGELYRAEAELYQVLELAPDHPLAREMLDQLGGVPAGAPASAHYTDDQTSTTDVTEPNADPSLLHLQVDEPLPSYDLEEISAEAFLSGDPYAHPPEAPLPSFPLGLDDEVVSHLEAERNAHVFDAGDVNTIDPSIPRAAGVPTAEPMDPATLDALEEALEEAEFFASRGLLDDARAILVDQLEKTPQHPLLLERLRELDRLSAKTAESGTRDRAALDLDESDFDVEDGAFDIAASLDALEEVRASSPPADMNPQEEVDVETVFAKFKEGVAREVSESDSGTHYDLGVAYREMGLHQDAIAEFEIAARDPKLVCTCCAMIGMIHLEQGELEKAAEAYIRGLGAAQKTVDQEMSLYYDLGVVYEMKGSTSEALYYFRKIARRDPGYRDVRDRVEALEGSARAKGTNRSLDGDGFDAAFDDLFESK